MKTGKAFVMNVHYNSKSKYVADPEVYICKDRRLYFLLCESCFWCATYLNSDIIVAKCPLCKDSRVESLPILYYEKYELGYDSSKHSSQPNSLSSKKVM